MIGAGLAKGSPEANGSLAGEKKRSTVDSAAKGSDVVTAGAADKKRSFDGTAGSSFFTN